jgi:hypothetical protein
VNSQTTTLLIVGALWAAAPLVDAFGVAGDARASWIAAAAAFAAVLIAPGYLFLSRLGGRGSEKRLAGEIEASFAMPAPAFVVSLAMVATCAGLSRLLESGPQFTLLLVGAISVCLALFPAKVSTHNEPVSGDSEFAMLAVFAALVGLMGAVAMTAGGENLSEPALWAFAHAQHDVATGAYSTRDAVLGAIHTPIRFHHDAWVIGLGAWAALTGASRWILFERLAPIAIVVLAGSASLGLARTIFAPGVASLSALLSVGAALATRVPSPAIGTMALPVGIAEDIIVAALVILPTTLAAAISVTFGNRRTHVSPWATMFFGAIVLVATDAAAAQAAAVACAGVGIAAISHDNSRLGRALLTVGLVAAVALTGLPDLRRANNQASYGGDLDRGAALTGAPPVRAPLRTTADFGDGELAIELVERAPNTGFFPPTSRSRHGRDLIELGVAGPTMHPSNVADPLLILALLGTAIALAQRTRRSSAILLGLTIPALAFAFAPGISAGWIAWVSDWRATTVLWVVPFGALAALFVTRTPGFMGNGRVGRTLMSALVWSLVVAACIPVLPLHRMELSARAAASRGPGADPDLRELFEHLRALPQGSSVAAAAGIAPLIPAFTGVPVLATGHTGTLLFAKTTEGATSRRSAAAALTGLTGGSADMLSASAKKWQVSHILLEGAACDSHLKERARAGRFTLCEVLDDQPQKAAFFASPATQAPDAEKPIDLYGAPLLADLSSGWTCTPKHSGVGVDRVLLWKARERWTARPVQVACGAALLPSSDPSGIEIRLSQTARTSPLAYRVEALGGDPHFAESSGTAKPDADGRIRLAVPAANATSVRVVLVTSSRTLRLRDLRLYGRAVHNTP